MSSSLFKDEHIKSDAVNETTLREKNDHMHHQKETAKERNELLNVDDDNMNNISAPKKKTKTKKSKKGEADKQNISVKSSFSKFDALQKRNLIHVRSIDACTAQEKFSVRFHYYHAFINLFQYIVGLL
ncbi:uncharacterized protein LOC111689956 [Lucilia cuprina]|uniref:uncharacterized protein LOC111689956 n=1 Tax=Lucilia cuprina TaxID=7375 RepID=UPI001F061BC8|nr:uncharacterized protein LOC111689956 [Lucilia cuprina]XP_046812308.1 uncharacterized protein LOC111689956 [Lucilia cuprina]